MKSYHLPIKIRIPAAIANIPMITAGIFNPKKVSPQTINKIANKSIPRFSPIRKALLAIITLVSDKLSIT